MTAHRGTILTRLTTALREQNWTAVVLELLIVTLGVVMGSLIAGWNSDRQEQAEVEGLVTRILPDFQEYRTFSPAYAEYYSSRMDLARKAERLFVEGGNDAELVEAAYLTGSHAVILDFDNDVYSLRVGSQTISKIDDPTLRETVADALAALNDQLIKFEAINSDFRIYVRQIVSVDLQDKLADECNMLDPEIQDTEEQLANLARISVDDCDISLPPEEVARIAAKLRSDPRTLGLLREHYNRLVAAQFQFDQLPDVLAAAVVELEKIED